MNKDNPGTLAVIDWEEAVLLAGGNPNLAKELFAMLLDELPRRRDQITRAYAAGDREQLQVHVHKVHGSTAYCGVPALRESSNILEAAIIKGDTNLTDQFDQVLADIEDVLQEGGAVTS